MMSTMKNKGGDPSLQVGGDFSLNLWINVLGESLSKKLKIWKKVYVPDKRKDTWAQFTFWMECQSAISIMGSYLCSIFHHCLMFCHFEKMVEACQRCPRSRKKENWGWRILPSSLPHDRHPWWRSNIIFKIPWKYVYDVVLNASKWNWQVPSLVGESENVTEVYSTREPERCIENIKPIYEK